MVLVRLIAASAVWHAWPLAAGPSPPNGLEGRRTESIEPRTAPAPFESAWVRVLRNINTECKLCPSPDCLNKDWFGSSYQFQAVCWAQGAKVGNTT
jgi:hypothetical protein